MALARIVTDMPSILIAPNAFKHGIDAATAARAIARGLQSSNLVCRTVEMPVSDGGDGLKSVLVAALRADLVPCHCRDPLGRWQDATFGWSADRACAIIEYADAGGLRLIADSERNPVTATSAGVGDMIACALDLGARQIIIGLGGSATIDGGFGLLRALGLRVTPHDADGWEDVEAVDLDGLTTRLSGVAITVLADVDNPLLGDSGAVPVFGAQKGMRGDQHGFLERRLASMIGHAPVSSRDGLGTLAAGGAAGGVAAGLMAFAGAHIASGIDFVLDTIGFDAALETCDLVITAEGMIDRQTSCNKAPAGIARRAHAAGKPVIALAGAVPPDADDAPHRLFDALLPIGPHPRPVAAAIAATEPDLVRTAKSIGDIMHLAGPWHGPPTACPVS